jgi:hypothetical protein
MIRHFFLIPNRINKFNIHYAMGVLNVTAVHTTFGIICIGDTCGTATIQGLPKIMPGFQPLPQE